jgi:pilus assembly protein CpaB
MSPRRLIFIVIALVAAGATIFVGRAWLAVERGAHVEVQATPEPPKPSKMVLVAASDLHAGQFVRPEHLRWQAWPDEGISKNYVVSGDHQLEDYVGAVVRTGIGEGEPVTDVRVVRPGDRGFLAAVLTPGNRAVTVPVTPSSGIAGFVFPGDRVDLIATLKLVNPDTKEKSENHASETVLTNLRVLALDQRADDQSKEIAVAKTATLEVTPKQAEVIAVVSEVGKLSLSLRSLAHDENHLEDPQPRLTYTFDSEATQLIRPPSLHGAEHRVIVVRGNDVKEVDFVRGTGVPQPNTANDGSDR